MQDKGVSPKEKLIFASLIVRLAMGFSELCNNIFREEPTTDRIQALINQHTYEEHFHWQWLLKDIEKLELNQYLKLTDAMMFTYGEATQKPRAVCYQLYQHVYQTDPILKLVAMQVSEVTANVFFTISKPIALELKEITGKDYRYFGMCHMDKEDNHEINTPTIVNFLEEFELTIEQRQKAITIADLTFQAYTEAMNSFMDFVK